MDIVHSPACLSFERPDHPDSPQRVRLAAEHLKSLGYTFVEPRMCSEEDLLRVHSKEHVQRIRDGVFFEVGTPGYKDIYDHARLAAGGAILAAERGGFSLMRPPGHHAGRNFHGGFSYFNNIAIAVARLGLKTLIIDIDGHHGNGTQDIFNHDPGVEYLSLHTVGFPGTGMTSGANYANSPFVGQVGDQVYLGHLEALLASAPQAELVAVSAGFDAFVGDPLASLGLSRDCFNTIGLMIQGLGLPTFSVLEGGYVPEELGPNIHAFLQGLAGVRVRLEA
jgi:acetoin utilization deacetylase AcuC-like enzyme